MKTTFNSIHFTTILFGIIFCGCTRIYYSPTAQNVPFLSEQNEIRIVGSQSSNECIAFDIQASYSPIYHLGIMVNTSWCASTGGDVFRQGNPDTGHLIEGGAGYYFRLDESSLAECYAGFGSGSLNYQWSSDTVADIKFNRIFIQPAFGFKKDVFEIGFSGRLSIVDYTNIDEMQSLNSYSNYFGTPQTNQAYIFIEPAITARLGFRAMKLQFQYQKAYKIGGTTLSYSNYNMIFGAIMSPSEFFKREDENSR
ncbi:MAG: hypothetical protein ACHQFW_06620 [Chitinophagales bacterium]